MVVLCLNLNQPIAYIINCGLMLLSSVMFKYNMPLAFIFQPKSGIKAAYILCIVEHLVCLIHKVVAGYVKRIRQARCRQAKERCTGSNGKQLKIFDKRPNARFEFKLSLLSNYSAIRCVRFVKTHENILQNTFFLTSLLAKTNTQKQAISPYFQPFIFYFYAIFERITSI